MITIQKIQIADERRNAGIQKNKKKEGGRKPKSESGSGTIKFRLKGYIAKNLQKWCKERLSERKMVQSS